MRLTSVLWAALTIAMVFTISLALTEHSFVGAVPVAGLEDDDGDNTGDSDDGDDDDGGECLRDNGDDGPGEESGDDQPPDDSDGADLDLQLLPDGDYDIEPDDCILDVPENPTTVDDEVDPADEPAPAPDTVSGGVNGDANCDGGISSVDAIALLRSLGGASVAAACASYDADCSGAVDGGDITRILRIVAGLSDPC